MKRKKTKTYDLDYKIEDFDPEQIDFLDFQSDLLEDQDFLDDIVTYFPENAHIDDHTVFLEGILRRGRTIHVGLG